jgi:hypothetical protein
MKLLIDWRFNSQGQAYTACCILDKFETDEFFTYQDYLHLFPTGNIVGICDSKGRLIPNRYGIDLSKYSDSLQLNSLCSTCKHKDNCKNHKNIIGDCPVRQFAAKALSASDFIKDAYYKALDELVSLADTYFKAAILFDPVKNILKGGE